MEKIALLDAIASMVVSEDDLHRLTPQQRGEMAVALADFVEDSIKKFINGQIEHGGNIADRDLDKEIRAETIDIFWYNTAKAWVKK